MAKSLANNRDVNINRTGLVLLKQRLTASERKWPVRWADVRGEERVTSLRTSAWEATKYANAWVSWMSVTHKLPWIASQSFLLTKERLGNWSQTWLKNTGLTWWPLGYIKVKMSHVSRIAITGLLFTQDRSYWTNPRLCSSCVSHVHLGGGLLQTWLIV